MKMLRLQNEGFLTQFPASVLGLAGLLTVYYVGFIRTRRDKPCIAPLSPLKPRTSPIPRFFHTSYMIPLFGDHLGGMHPALS